MAGAAGDEAFTAKREERVDGGEVVDWVLVGGGAAGWGAHVVESGGEWLALAGVRREGRDRVENV